MQHPHHDGTLTYTELTGAITLDHVDFGYVPVENIRYGNPEVTEEECIAAAKLANADSFIRMLPDGYDTILQGDGSGLSQGQRQLLVIAHRLSTVQNSNVIMVLDQGHIIERGTHEQLITEKGTYYQLYTGAFKLE